MGPQLDSCGRMDILNSMMIESLASMGPQLDSCGRVHKFRFCGVDHFASMGPQLDSCGRLAWLFAMPLWPMLQWGRNLIVAEGDDFGDIHESEPAASMGPQLDSCGRYVWFTRGRGALYASMGPQLDSCGRPAPAPDSAALRRNARAGGGRRAVFRTRACIGIRAGPSVY